MALSSRDRLHSQAASLFESTRLYLRKLETEAAVFSRSGH